MVNIEVDVSGAMQGLDEFQDRHLPFGIALSLTKTAQAGQVDSQQLEQSTFVLRNDWTVRGTRIVPATKTNLVATVYTDTSNWSTGAPDYLPRQEDGGEKVPLNGRMHLAIPTDNLRRLAGGTNAPIPDWLRPKALLTYAQENGKYVVTRGKLKGNVRSAPKAVRGIYFFRVTFKSGVEGILARYVTDARNVVYPMYIFVTRANLRKRFPMEETVQATVNRVFEEQFNRSLIETHMDGVKFV